MNKDLNNIRNHDYCRKAGFMLFIFWAAISFIAMVSSIGSARLNTESCIDCHVVHAWQDKKEKDSKPMYASILEKTCEECHTSHDSRTLVKFGQNIIPIVKSAIKPEAPLAGGNFYYTSGQIHLKKAGYCTSCHVDVRHHATNAGYRFLGEDIEGIGDPMYEFGDDGHNIYKSGDQYCIACHANFCGSKNQEFGAGWIRHPTNITLPMLGEYSGYKVYRKDVPVCYPNPEKPERSTARVMCMSCHRPHGTPYHFLLRWDYNTMLAGNGNNSTGCFACHTTKDTGTIVQEAEIGE
ncbi:MAG: cytochrome c3 family protein [Desulfobacteraceae bacterium]|nr:cytochrome c3 family protein [Desulfobacteraceae bacterium]MBC2720288.1 cytochrome c3 family protein [Desulfobacteraceae bacterium]